MEKTLGGDRLGSGKKMKVQMHNYERSNHDLSYAWRSTMAPGTLVPFMVEIGLPGDSWDIELEADVKTFPTLAPLFGSFKLQLDVFTTPIRLYHSALHNNKLGVGMEMSKVKFPKLRIIARERNPVNGEPAVGTEMNPSHILAYLGIMDPGQPEEGLPRNRKVIAMPLLSYWDIYKNYYANKQEGFGIVMQKTKMNDDAIWASFDKGAYSSYAYSPAYRHPSETYITFENAPNNQNVQVGDRIMIFGTEMMLNANQCVIQTADSTGTTKEATVNTFTTKTYEDGRTTIIITQADITAGRIMTNAQLNKTKIITYNSTPGWQVPRESTAVIFPLERIDEIKEEILQQPWTTEYELVEGSGWNLDEITLKSAAYNSALNGLLCKTYQSDIFNNWLNREWLDGENGINEITKIDTSDGLKIESLILAKKVYNMLNRIAISGGSYNDWLEAVYTEESYNRPESPVYMGGLSKEIVFSEVVNQSSNWNSEKAEGAEPLGTLAGRGHLSPKHKGGSVKIKVSEPSIIMGIVSITPRIDYSQGNRWFTVLSDMDDLHKPALDGIGFQDLVTWKMHGGDSIINSLGWSSQWVIGKQPSWIDYMTNFNRCYGEFAKSNSQMFMTLNRRYSMLKTTLPGETAEYKQLWTVGDATTYIEPGKYNYAFADTSKTAQNFWVQIGCNIMARRKVSAKQIPNL